MTLDEAKQKILDRVLATTEGWREAGSLYGEAAGVSSSRTSLFSDDLGVGVHRCRVSFTTVGGRECLVNLAELVTAAATPTVLLNSDEFPQLLEWWQIVANRLSEKKVILFAKEAPMWTHEPTHSHLIEATKLVRKAATGL